VTNGLPPPSEEEVQAVIVDGLQALGYVVRSTVRRPKKCPRCGSWPRSGSGDGVSRGLADLLVRHRSWPAYLWVQLEVKRPGPVRYSSLEQRAAVESAEIAVVQSLDDALAILERIRPAR
jgi:hypothetical protein